MPQCITTTVLSHSLIFKSKIILYHHHHYISLLQNYINDKFGCSNLDCYEASLISNTYLIPSFSFLVTNVTSVKICQLQCQLDPACLSFTYSSQGQDMCILSGTKYSNELRRLDKILGGISGPKFCNGMQFYFL